MAPSSDNPEENELFEILQRRKKAAEQPQGAGSNTDDWSRDRDEWIGAATALLNRIEEWLSREKTEGLINTERTMISVTEQRLGTYDIPQLQLRLAGDDFVVIRPVFRSVMGGTGRVDVIAGPEREMLLRDKSGDWHHVRRGATGPPERTKLTPAVFRTLVASLLPG